MKALLALHIVGGAIGIISGYTALLAGKGSSLHRRAGVFFVFAMVTMATTGAGIGLAKEQWGNVVGGGMALYFVITALTTVRSAPRWIDIAATVLAIAVGMLSLWSAADVISQGRTSKDGVPVFMIVFMGVIPLLAAFGDYRVLRAGGIKGSRRMIRHLWRMNFSLWIAAGSFFTIRERVAMILPDFTPDVLLSFPIRLVPVLLPLLAIFYWIWKIKLSKKFKPVSVRRPTDVGDLAT